MNYKEIWKDIPGTEGKYQASNLGNVRSINYNGTKKIKNLSQFKNRDYLSVKITINGINKGMPVHRLIALAFYGYDNNKPEINHIDGNKHNNNVNNLEWCTRKENVLHAYKNGLKKAPSGKEHVKSRPVYQIKNGKIINKFDYINETEKYGFLHSKVVLCCEGKRNSHGGYSWKYAD